MSVNLSYFLASAGGGGVQAIPANTFNPATMIDVTGFYSNIISQEQIFNDLGIVLPNHDQDNAVVAHNTDLYSIGGNQGGTNTRLNTLTKIDTILGTVIPLAPMPVALAEVAAAVVGNIIYVAGGKDAASAPVNTFYSYDIVNNIWTTLPVAPAAIFTHRMVSVGTKLYMFGGRGASYTLPSLDVHIYDTVAGSWSLGQITPKEDPTAVNVNAYSLEVVGTMIYLISGYEGLTSGAINKTGRMLAFNTATDTWSVTTYPNLPAPVSGANAGVNRALSAVIGGNIYVLSGLDVLGANKNVYMYNPTTNLWTSNPGRQSGNFQFGQNSAVEIGGHMFIATYRSTPTEPYLEAYNPLQIPSTTQQKIIITKG